MEKRLQTGLLIALTAAQYLIPASAIAQQPDSATVSLSEVVVTGSNQAVRRNLLPYTVTTVDHAALNATGTSEVLTAISGMVPSLFVTQRNILGFGVSNGGAGHIKMRGVGGDRASAVLMMVDGQPQFAGIYSHHVADFYTKEYVDKVEVLRGPGSVLYGSNAMAGVINVITRQTQTHGFSASLTSQYGSYNTTQNSLTATARHGRLSALASVNFDRTDGTVKNFDFSQWEGYAKISYRINHAWKTAASVTLSNFTGNDPIYPKLSNPESTDIYHQNITRSDVALSASNNYANTTGNIQAYYSWGNHYIDDPRHFHSLDDRLGLLAYQNITPWTEAQMTAGFDFNTYSGHIPVSGGNQHKPGSMSTISRKRITEYSPYLTLSQNLANRLLTINAGLRMANSDKFGSQWIPQGGAAVNLPNGYTLKGSVAMGYRNPSFRELYLYKMANPDLKPEKMTNYEFSVIKNFGHTASLDLTLYYSHGTNMIQVVDMKNVNTGRFTNKGIELSGRLNPTGNVRISASYSYLHSSLHNLTGAPRHQYYIGINWLPIKKLYIGADIKGISRLFVADSQPLESFAIANIKAEYKLFKQLTLMLRLENITDARYEINRGYRMPGFTAIGGFRLSLSTNR